MSYPSGYSEPPTMDDLVEHGRAEGRREMLWLVAVGAACESELSTFTGELDTTTRYYLWITMHAVSQDALRVLVDLGDERAREMLR